MEKLRESVLSSFEDGDLDRVDKYVDMIRDSLKSTNSRFGSLTLLLIISIFSYHLYINGQLSEISAFGLKIKDTVLIKKWFLIVPSLIFLLTTSIGYLRVYQQESIEWLLAKYRPKEYKSGIYRLIFPSSYILGLDVLRRQKSIIARSIATLAGTVLALGAVAAPIWYIYWAYNKAFMELGRDTGLIINCSVSGILLVCGLCIICQSQRI